MANYTAGPVKPQPINPGKQTSYGMKDVDPSNPNKRLVTTPLGNIQYENISAERPQEVSDLVARYKALSEQGYSAPEYAAARAQQAQQVNAQGQMANRALLAAQAKQGIRGGAAVAQQQRIAQQLAAQRSALEQNLMLENIKNRQQNLGQYGSVLGSAINRETDLAKFGLNKDIAAQITGLGGKAFETQMGLAGRELDIGEKQFNDYLDWLKKLNPEDAQKLGIASQVSVNPSGSPHASIGPERGGGFSTDPWGGSGSTYGGGY